MEEIKRKRATGPRTPSGKARSAMNALRHGLRAQTLVLPGEARAQLDLLRQCAMVEFDPVEFSDSILVEQLVRALWKQQRLERVEYDLWDRRNRLSGKAFDSIGAVFWADCVQVNSFSNLLRYTSAVNREVRMLLKELEKRKRERMDQSVEVNRDDVENTDRDDVVNADCPSQPEVQSNDQRSPESRTDAAHSAQEELYEAGAGAILKEAAEYPPSAEQELDRSQRIADPCGLYDGAEQFGELVFQMVADDDCVVVDRVLNDLSRERGACFGSPRGCRFARLFRTLHRIARVHRTTLLDRLYTHKGAGLVARAKLDDLWEGELGFWNQLFAVLDFEPEYVCECESGRAAAGAVT